MRAVRRRGGAFLHFLDESEESSSSSSSSFQEREVLVVARFEFGELRVRGVFKLNEHVVPIRSFEVFELRD